MQTLNFNSRFGQVRISLHIDRAPETCAYFVDLVKRSAFAPASVFRIVTSSGLQKGDALPASSERAINIVQIGPSQRFAGPRHTMTHEDTQTTGITHRQWTVSAARFDLGELYGSFFICMKDEPELDYGGQRQPDGQGFAAFGEVIEGFDALEKIFAHAEESELLSNDIPISNLSVAHHHDTQI